MRKQKEYYPQFKTYNIEYALNLRNIITKLEFILDKDINSYMKLHNSKNAYSIKKFNFIFI